MAYRSKPACPTSPSGREHVGAAKASEPPGGWPYCARGGDDLPAPLPATSRSVQTNHREIVHRPRPILLSPHGGSGGSAPGVRRAEVREPRAPCSSRSTPSTKLVSLLLGSRGSGSWPLALTSSNGCDRTYSSRPRAGRGGRRRRVSSRPGPAVEFGGCGVAYRSKPACPASGLSRARGSCQSLRTPRRVAVLRPRRRRPPRPAPGHLP